MCNQLWRDGARESWRKVGGKYIIVAGTPTPRYDSRFVQYRTLEYDYDTDQLYLLSSIFTHLPP